MESVDTFGGTVGTMLPAGFAAYARVLHRPDQGLPDETSARSWAEVARRHGTVVHPEVQWTALAGGRQDSPRDPTDPESPTDEPACATLDRLTLPLLARVLAAHTATPGRCHTALWDGFGQSPWSWQDRPTWSLPGRTHWLFAPVPVLDVPALSVELEVRGAEEELGRHGELRTLVIGGPGNDDPVARADASRRWVAWLRESGSVQSPTWWWPEDRAWVVHSEIDHDSTLVAGSRAPVAALRAEPGIEALEVTAATSLLAGADRVNT